MATEEFVYLSYPEAVAYHIELMEYLGETRFGVFDKTLIESALARPQQAAAYTQADIFAQAATLCFGLIKNHPWVGGNKRTASLLTEVFLRRNGFHIVATAGENLEMVLAVESNSWSLETIAEWMKAHTEPFPSRRSR
jgi:death on curing protein